MQDILDPRLSPIKLGLLSVEALRLARNARDALNRYGVPMAVFVDPNGEVYAHPAAYSTNRPSDEMIGVYAPGMAEADIAEDLRAAEAARLAAMGMATGASGASPAR